MTSSSLSRPVVFAPASTQLSEEESLFFATIKPVGIILFRRNIKDAVQLKALTDSLRALLGEDLLILIDQEGGKVARLTPPHFPELPAAALYGTAYAHSPKEALEALALHTKITAAMLHKCGIQVVCAPVADLLHEGAHSVIGDRSYGSNLETVIALTSHYVATALSSGMLPIIKHIPGHGPSKADSHVARSHVTTALATLEAADFAVFKALNHVPMAMTAHVVYDAIDPELPATLSPKVIDYIRNTLGFSGIIITDALEMKALSGKLNELATQALKAGCDIVLHCSGNMAEMQSVAQGVGEWDAVSYERYRAHLPTLQYTQTVPMEAMVASLESCKTRLQSVCNHPAEESMASSALPHPAFEA
jgi:beta-N-acetylhexosaminidase